MLMVILEFLLCFLIVIIPTLLIAKLIITFLDSGLPASYYAELIREEKIKNAILSFMRKNNGATIEELYSLCDKCRSCEVEIEICLRELLFEGKVKSV